MRVVAEELENGFGIGGVADIYRWGLGSEDRRSAIGRSRKRCLTSFRLVLCGASLGRNIRHLRSREFVQPRLIAEVTILLGAKLVGDAAKRQLHVVDR